MKELKNLNLNKIEKVGYNEELNQKTFTIEGLEMVLEGGEFSASGVKNYLRPVEKVLENRTNRSYLSGRQDVKYYVKNSTMKAMQNL